MTGPDGGGVAGVGGVGGAYVSFTEVTDPAEHGSYNSWHLFDHLPEQGPLPGVVWGARWVGDPSCRRAWRPPTDPRLGAAHYLTVYLLADPLDRSVEVIRRRGRELRDLGRFHHHRVARLAGPLRVEGARAAPRVAVSAEAVPHRPALGVHVRVEPVDEGSSRADPGAALARLVAVPGVAGVWSFVAGEGDLTWSDGAERAPAPPLRLTVAWLDDEPVGVAGRLGAGVSGERAGTPAHPERPPLLDGPWGRIDPWGPFDWFDPAPGP